MTSQEERMPTNFHLQGEGMARSSLRAAAALEPEHSSSPVTFLSNYQTLRSIMMLICWLALQGSVIRCCVAAIQTGRNARNARAYKLGSSRMEQSPRRDGEEPTHTSSTSWAVKGSRAQGLLSTPLPGCTKAPLQPQHQRRPRRGGHPVRRALHPCSPPHMGTTPSPTSHFLIPNQGNRICLNREHPTDLCL